MHYEFITYEEIAHLKASIYLELAVRAKVGVTDNADIAFKNCLDSLDLLEKAILESGGFDK